MAEKRKFLICYDIVDDKRLRRVHQLLSNSELESLKEKIMPCIDSTVDKVSIYRLFQKNAKIQLAKTAPDDIMYI